MSDVRPRLEQALLVAVDRLDLPLTVRQVGELAVTAAVVFDPPPSPLPVIAVDDLTGQQLAVLYGLADGERVADTARRMFISEHTVRSHKHALFRKLGVKTAGHAVARAHALGLLRRGPLLSLQRTGTDA